MSFKAYFIRHLIACLILLGGMITFPSMSYADELKEIRIRAGLELFTSILAADQQLTTKKDFNNTLNIVIIHRNNKRLAEKMAVVLMKQKTIRGTKINIYTAPLKKLNTFKGKKIAGIFITQRLQDDLGKIIQLGKEKRAIAFSPFPDDVENGVSSGFIITDVISPYLNLKSLRDASININPYFLKVAELYEN